MQDLIKRAAEWLSVVVIVSYAAGFLIVNSYLLTYGYSGSSLFKVKYIGAGVLFLLLCSLLGISIYPMFWAMHQARQVAPPPPETRRKAIIFGTGLSLYIVKVVLDNIADQEIRDSSFQKNLWFVGDLLLVSLILTVLENLKNPPKWAAWAKNYPGASLLLLWAGVFLSSFTWDVIGAIALIAFAIGSIMDVFMKEESLLVRFKEWPIGVIWGGHLTLASFSRR